MFYWLPARLYPLLYRVITWYYRKPRRLRKHGIELELLPSVFHPSLYLSTDILLDFLLTKEIEGKKVLELGCGSGWISLYLAKNKGTEAFASDINETAIEGLQTNAKRNGVEITTFHSDLFTDIPPLTFDYVLVNPPFYPKNPISKDEFAFFAGEDLAYFQQFFTQVKAYLERGSQCLMILSENAAIEGIASWAQQSNLCMQLEKEVYKKRENFMIYAILT